LTVSDENTGLRRTDEYVTVLARVYVDTSIRVEKEDIALLAIRNLELLHEE
jgi:hypothetical protein